MILGVGVSIPGITHTVLYGKLHKDQIDFDIIFWETDISITNMTLKSG